MFSTLLITFREGLEAFLMVAIAALYLRKTGHVRLMGAVRTGLLVSIALSVVLGAALAQLGGISPAWEGGLALLAAAAVVWCVVHMRQMGRQMGQEISAGLGRASNLAGPQAWWTVFGFTVFMVGREGMESAAMLASLASSAEGVPMLVGGVVGLLVAASVALLWVRFGREVNLTRFFNVTSVFMLVFAAMLVVKGVYEFTEVGLIPLIDNEYWHELTESLAEGRLAQVLSAALVAAPTLWLVAAHLRERRVRAATAA